MAYDYNAQIKRLTKYPDEIMKDWLMSIGLFQFATDETNEDERRINNCGCLTMIRALPNHYKVLVNGKINREITEAISNDNRIPKNRKSIKPKHFPVFKEWQERLDQYRNKD